MKQKIKVLAALLGGAVLVVTLLYQLTPPMHGQNNGFKRKILPGVIDGVRSLDVGFNTYYFLGVAGSRIYLGNHTASGHLLSCTLDLKDSTHLRLPIPGRLLLNWAEARLHLDSPFLYLSEGTSASFLVTHLPLKDSMRIIVLPKFFFTEALPLSPNSFVVRGYDPATHQNMLVKLGPQGLYKGGEILQKQAEGIFSTDGKLLRISANELAYLYYYRNQFMVMDSNLQNMGRYQLLDTNSRAKIQIDTNYVLRLETFSSPPLLVNQKAFATTSHLFIVSGLIADNEPEKMFRDHAVIDVYSTRTGHYQFSFYVPTYHGEKAADYFLKNDCLLALYDHYLLCYHLTQSFAY